MKKLVVIMVLAASVMGFAKNKKVHTLDEYNLAGSLYRDALPAPDTAGLWHSGDGEYACTAPTADRGANCFKDAPGETYIKVRLTNGKGGLFRLISERDSLIPDSDPLENLGMRVRVCTPAINWSKEQTWKQLLATCDLPIRYREENGRIFVPYFVMYKAPMSFGKAKLTVFEAEYEFEEIQDMRDRPVQHPQ